MATERRSRVRGRAEEDDAPAPRRGAAAERDRPSAGMYGAAGYKRAKEEAAKAEAKRSMARRGPNRMWLEDGTDDVEVIVVDASTDELFYMHEHAIWNGKGNDFVPCLRERGVCPLCEAAEEGGKDNDIKPSYFAMFFSVIDTRPYKVKTGDRAGEVVPFSKRLMVIKHSQIDRFHKILRAAENKHGTTRGVVLNLSRHGAKSARTGEPTIFEDGQIYQMETEKTLKADFSSPAIKRDGKIVKQKDDALVPFDYRKEFTLPDAIELAKAFDLPTPTGSREALEEEWDEDKPRARRGRAAEPEDAEEAPARRRGRAAEVDEDDVEEAPPPRRGRRQEAEEEPAPRSRGRGRAAEVEEDEEVTGDEDDLVEDDAEEEPAPRRRGRAEPEEEAPRGRRRAPVEEVEDDVADDDLGDVDEDEEIEEEPPARSRKAPARTVRNAKADEDPPARQGRARTVARTGTGGRRGAPF